MQSLQEHSFSSKLNILIQDKEQLYISCQANVFFCNPYFVQAMLICLEAIVQNQICHLAEIDPNLICQSFCKTIQISNTEIQEPPYFGQLDNLLKISKEKNQKIWPICKKLSMMDNSLSNLTNSESSLPDSVNNIKIIESSKCDLNEQINNSNTSYDSNLSIMPNHNHEMDNDQKKTDIVRKTYTQHVRSKSDFIFPKYNLDAILPHDSAQSSEIASLSSSLPVRMEARRQSFLEGGGSSIFPSTECFFPRPVVGQSLTSFLSSQDFHICAELDKENAHFSISEALIAAIEQMKCNRMLRPKNAEDEIEDGDSDDEIQQLKQRIRIRRRECQREKANNDHLLSDGRTDTTTSHSSSQPCSPLESTLYSDDSSGESVDDIGYSESSECNLRSLSESGISLSVATLFSDSEVRKYQDYGKTHCYEKSCEMPTLLMSAESVALCLLKKFSEKQLPKASDLEWLVSEQDAPQSLLPLPNSWPVSPDEAEDVQQLKQTRLRGNLEWAPPRAQIIFNIHATPKLKVLMAKQNYRCAGCGMRTEPAYSKRFRYCEYLGKYFCQYCHSNSLSLVPSRILRKWDFTKYYVSNFSRDLLNKMFTDPLFNILDINASLYRKVRSLDLLKDMRLQLFYIRKFLRICRLGESLWLFVQDQPSHWIEEPHLYSLQDLIQVKSGALLIHMRRLILSCLNHIAQCELCLAKGFICEFCNNNKDVIFPFQLQKVIQCSACQSCFHKACFIPDKCPKCIRIDSRNKILANHVPSDDENFQD